MLLMNLLNMLRPVRNEEGQGMVEYALIIGLIAVVVIAVLVLLGDNIAALFQGIADQLNPPAAP